MHCCGLVNFVWIIDFQILIAHESASGYSNFVHQRNLVDKAGILSKKDMVCERCSNNENIPAHYGEIIFPVKEEQCY